VAAFCFYAVSPFSELDRILVLRQKCHKMLLVRRTIRIADADRDDGKRFVVRR
jgi:hypothetical protein